MNLIIDRLGDSIKPFAEGLLQLLPEVWQDAEGQSLLRIQVSLASRQLQSFSTHGHAYRCRDILIVRTMQLGTNYCMNLVLYL